MWYMEVFSRTRDNVLIYIVRVLILHSLGGDFLEGCFVKFIGQI